MMRTSLLCLLAVLAMIASTSAFGNSEDKFIKKYAMMKIYESCFGPDVVKQIRKDMKAACAKCASYELPLSPPKVPTTTIHSTLPPGYDKKGDITDPENTLYANQQTFDADKLHQALLAYRPNPFSVPAYRPYQQPFYNAYTSPGFSAPLYYPGSFPQAFGAPYNYPVFPQQYMGSSRVSRQMDIKGQLEALTKMTGRVRNVTCVMQELGYLDENLEPNYEKITERIGNLPVPEELRKDMQDGVAFCQQFSQCVPEIKREKSPLSRELVRPMFFFKCYKHKKLEACIMKDVREKYSGVNEEDFDGEVEFRRTGKSAKFQDDDIDGLATSMYEFLYGSDSNIDVDSLF